MTGSIRNFEKQNFTAKSRVFVSLKVKLPVMTDWHIRIWSDNDVITRRTRKRRPGPPETVIW